jgi:succinate-semialdehyde dehydrogenase/glutarate-semialdehyde dehydrogenase
MPIQSLNPATGKLLRSFDPLTPEALNSRLALAAAAAKSYPSESLDQRIFWMRRLASLLDDDIEELAALMTSEMGKTISASRQEIRKCAAGCRYYAENAARILASEHIATDNAQSYVRYDPIGIILAVMPWNFPLWQVFRFLAPALMAGNVGLLKHASNVPQCALAIEALVRRAGFPRGTFQTLLIEARQVEGLLSDDRIVAVTVTGSEAAGRAIAAQSGWLLKKTVLELGGSDPFIVLPSANLDLAVPNAIKARCINNGQSCIAAKRFLIHEKIYDEFERRFVEGMAALRVGDPTLEATEIGPLATPQILDELIAQVARAKSASGAVLTGGDRASIANSEGLAGNYFQPTVIAGVLRTAPICQEEIFGPVALLFRITSLDDAIALANDTPFGLAASAWTTDAAEQQRLAVELQCGAVFFNAVVSSDPRLPFGGTKHSGYGRELSTAGMREFLNAKTVVVSGSAVHTRPTPAEQSKLHPAPEPPNENRSEFLQIADQMRRFEPRKPEPHEHDPKPRKFERSLPAAVLETTPEDAHTDPPPARGSILGLR